jgi:hypothetical protein
MLQGGVRGGAKVRVGVLACQSGSLTPTQARGWGVQMQEGGGDTRSQAWAAAISTAEIKIHLASRLPLNYFKSEVTNVSPLSCCKIK